MDILPLLLSADFELLTWSCLSVSYHMKSKNTVGEVQTSNGEHLRYGIIPNKHCMIVKLY
jgi:hypothetical protein